MVGQNTLPGRDLRPVTMKHKLGMKRKEIKIMHFPEFDKEEQFAFLRSSTSLTDVDWRIDGADQPQKPLRYP